MKLLQDKPYYAQMNWKEVENTLIEDWDDCELFIPHLDKLLLVFSKKEILSYAKTHITRGQYITTEHDTHQMPWAFYVCYTGRYEFVPYYDNYGREKRDRYGEVMGEMKPIYCNTVRKDMVLSAGLACEEIATNILLDLARDIQDSQLKKILCHLDIGKLYLHCKEYYVYGEINLQEITDNYTNMEILEVLKKYATPTSKELTERSKRFIAEGKSVWYFVDLPKIVRAIRKLNKQK